jgi:hypothetical protein
MIGAWLHGRKDVGKGEALVAKTWRALAALPPDVADTAFLADPGFVLKEQAKAFVFMRTLKFFQQRRSSF